MRPPFPLFVAFLLLSLLLPLSAPLVSAEPVNVTVGLYLLNLGKFDVSTGAFTADFYLSFKCDEACNPEFEFVNGRAASMERIIDEPAEKFYRIQANLNSPVDLKRFPFDEQRLQILLEEKRATIETLRFQPDGAGTGIDDSIAFVGWELGDWTAEESLHEYAIYDETYSQYRFTLPIKRLLVSSVFKTFLPIIFIILVMLSSFVLDPDKVTTRLAMVGSSLVASVMFHLSLANQIPPIGYLTFADKFMVLTYFVVLLSFVFNVLLLELHERKREKLVQKLHRSTEFTMFLLVPLLYVFLFLFFR